MLRGSAPHPPIGPKPFLSPGKSAFIAESCRRRPDGRHLPGRHDVPVVDGTMLLGARDDDMMIRVMDKVIDRQRPDGTHQRLTESEKRVRIEADIKGSTPPGFPVIL